MPIYRWYGISSNGEKIHGDDYAKNHHQLKIKLIKQNIYPIKIKLKNVYAFWHIHKIKSKHITAFIEQLAILINAHVPIVTALDIIYQDEKNEGLKTLIIDCKNSISAGQSLYKAFSKHPQYFGEISCNLINVGEQSGTLDIILKELSNYLTKIAIQKHKIFKALLYPIIVLNITLVVTIVLLLFVIPQFKDMYSNLGANLPSYTQFIINLGNFIQAHLRFILGFIISTAICIKSMYHRVEKFRQYLDNISLKIPLIKKILVYAIIVRFTKTLGLAFKSGVPLLKAINISSGTIQNWRYKSAIPTIAKSISNGKSLHSALYEQKIFPIRVVQLIALGEETGTLDIMLEKISTIYSEDLNTIIDNLNILLEPLIILILGFIVGGITIGMYLPIFRLGMIV